MKHLLAKGWRGLVIAALPLPALIGCAHNHTGRAASCEIPPECYDTPLCFGYYSTCWRPWPEECPNCPSPSMPPPTEQVVPPPPLTVEPLPPRPMPEIPEPGAQQPMQVTPMPAPMGPMPAPMGPLPMQPAPPTNSPQPPPNPNPPQPMPMPQPGADRQPSPGEEGMLRRRAVEGGFVSQPY